MKNYRKLETRALPTLVEQRNNLLDEMEDILKIAKEETRSFKEEELERYEEIKTEIRKLDKTIEAEEMLRNLDEKKPVDKKVETRELQEERAFENYIRGIVEERAEVNLTAGDNGAVIPSSIANKIIEKVYDISPIYQLATRYNVGGTLNIPYYDDDKQSITMAYATEFEELESTSGKFGSIELKGFLAGALSKVSRSLINNSDFKLVPYIINKMAEAISRWIEKELLNGTEGKIEGLSTLKQKVESQSATAIVTDELIDLQELIPDVYQENAIWIMNKDTRKAIRKLKDNEGRYLLNPDATAKWGYTLLGKDVYTSANMKTIEEGGATVFYGDMSGLAVKLAEDVNIEVLREKFATQHAIGVVGWIEIDSKIENGQKIAKLEMKTV